MKLLSFYSKNSAETFRLAFLELVFSTFKGTYDNTENFYLFDDTRIHEARFGRVCDYFNIPNYSYSFNFNYAFLSSSCRVKLSVIISFFLDISLLRNSLSTLFSSI